MAEMVLVGCKAPNGLILNLDSYEKIPGAQNNAVRRILGKTVVTLKGWAFEVGKMADPTITSGGYRLTAVDADFWDEWFKRNAESSLIHDRIILPPPPRAKAVDAGAQARDHDTVPKMFAPVKPSDVKGIEAAPRPT